ncbi:AmmeMemoRadiSam system protein B [Candidatus Woesearchaeota archaeon]|nr:AmmeMemoRadiSam system protein B [Candidatus Woesearchaeota archaeon]
MRKPAYAGSFYPKTVNALTKQIEACFNDSRGPGDLPVTKTKPDALPIKAIINPHAGYIYSGMAAAWGFAALAEAPLPEVFIMLGPSHRGGASGIAIESFETPFGFVRVDQELAKLLAKKGSLKINDELHANEHCIEVQLPFLQFSLGKRADHIKILPILVSEDIDLDKVASDLKDAIAELKRKVTFIVSSDFTHYGMNYGYVPFSTDIKQRIYKLDSDAIDLIKKGSANEFADYVYKTGATICGQLPITLLLKTITFKNAALEQYYTSGDLTNDYANSVSYACLVFR